MVEADERPCAYKEPSSRPTAVIRFDPPSKGELEASIDACYGSRDERTSDPHLSRGKDPSVAPANLSGGRIV